MDSTGFHIALILLGVAVVLVVLFRYLHLPQILAYLAAGVLVGPFGLGWVPDSATTRYLAEFGLVFLMFTLGLEFSLPKLMAMKVTVFGLGGAQVLFTAAVFGTIAWWLGVTPEGAIVIGGLLALSSTAIVMKLLVDQLEQSSRHGRQAFGVLLFQDLVVVPFLILIPALGGAGTEPLWLTLGWAFVKSVVVLVAIFVIGRWLLRPLFQEVASGRSRELFMFTVLLLTLASAWATEQAGLSLALGAFLAGMMVAETEYRHQVEGDILPFRDILLGLFFVTIGMLLDVHVLERLWPMVLAGVIALLLVKTLIVLVVGRLFGLESGVALRTGLVLSQGGEFGFALLLQARQFELLAGDVAQIVLAVVVLSMLLAPLVIRYNGVIAKRLVPSYTRARQSDLEVIRAEAASATSLSRGPRLGPVGEAASATNQVKGRTSEASRASGPSRGPADAHEARMAPRPRMAESALRPVAEARARKGHVIVCGFGRSGQNLGWMLEQDGIPYIALDLDPVRVRDARDAGKPVVYGDADRRDVLEAAGLAHASALVVSFENLSSALRILEITRHLRPDMPVIVRTRDDADLERLNAAGATEVVPESLEGSLMMGSHLLLLLGVPVARIVGHVRDVRRDRYRMLRGFFHGEDLFEEATDAAYRVRLHSVALPEGANAVGRQLAELSLDAVGVSVSAVRRGGIRGPDPGPETRLITGDVVVLLGTPEALEQAEKILLEG